MVLLRLVFLVAIASFSAPEVATAQISTPYPYPEEEAETNPLAEVEDLRGRMARLGTEHSYIRISGDFSAGRSIGDLRNTTVWMQAVADEDGNELLDLDFPVLLASPQYARETRARYGARLENGTQIRLLIAKRRRSSDTWHFRLRVKRVPADAPGLCDGSPPATELTTHFSLLDGLDAPVEVKATWVWNCGRNLRPVVPVFSEVGPTPRTYSTKEICAADSVITKNPDLQVQYPVMAACFSDKASSFRKMPWPLFWGGYGPGISIDAPQEWAAGYLRGLACMAKKSCTGITTVNFTDPANFVFINPWAGTQTPGTTPVMQDPPIYTQCLGQHLESAADSPVPSEVYLNISCGSELNTQCGWSSVIADPAVTAAAGIAASDADYVKVLKFIFATVKKLNAYGGAQITGLVGQFHGDFGPGNPKVTPDPRPDFWIDYVNHSQAILGEVLPFGAYGSGGVVLPDEAYRPESLEAQKTSLQPLYSTWEEAVLPGVSAPNRPNQDVCAAPGEAPAYTPPDGGDQKNDYTSTFFRCALPHDAKYGLPAQATCLDGTTMFTDYYPSWWSWAGLPTVTPPGTQGYAKSNLNNLLDQVVEIDNSTYDRLIWEFSVEQDRKRAKDLCPGFFFNVSGECGCGEPNALGILPLKSILEWYNAVADYTQPKMATPTKQQYAGFYQFDYAPIHFFTDAGPALADSWLSEPSPPYALNDCFTGASPVPYYDGKAPLFQDWYPNLCSEATVPSTNDYAKTCTCDVHYKVPPTVAPNAPAYDCTASYNQTLAP